MKESHQSASIPDRLPEPNDRLSTPVAPVVLDQAVLGHPVALVHGAHGEDEQDGEGRPGDEGEEFGVCEGVHVVDLEGLRDAELVDEVRHQLRVCLEGDEGGRPGLRVRSRIGRHYFDEEAVPRCVG